MILVDPDKNLVLVYNFEQGTSEPYTLQDSVKAGIYEDLWIDFSAMKMNGFYWKYFSVMLSLDTKNTEKIKKQKNKRLYMCL